MNKHKPSGRHYGRNLKHAQILHVRNCWPWNIHETILKISDPKSVLLKQASGKVIPDSFKLKDIKLSYESGENTETAQSVEQMYSTDKSCYYSHQTLVKS